MTDISEIAARHKTDPMIRYVRAGFGSYRVEVDGRVVGWVNPDPLGEGWWPHRHEAGDWGAPGPFSTRREAAEWLLQEIAE